MELSELIFTAKTDDLERVSKVIGGLVTDITQLDKVSRDAAKTEATLARAAKDNAKANLDNAKAQDVRLKSTVAADKADQQAAVAAEKKSKATEKATEATARQTSVLQKQKDILEFQTQGFSKGQAGILAYGKAAGLATTDIEELGKVLETQRKLMGGDPFDKSLSGLKSLQNQYTELKESIRQYNADSDLSSKQTRELARDKERLIEKMKVEGASFSDIRKAVRAHNEDYVKLAGQYNSLMSAEEAVIKNRKEVVSATNYVTQADQKMAAALNESNAAIDKAGTDSLVRYENALRKSGVSQEVATAKLAKYRVQLEQVQKQELARREQHLTRALAPQATDVVVSLWSGQNPLTVLLQQGGQVTDLFMQSGIAAEKFGEVVKKSMASMLPSILTVVKGVGGLLVDGFMAVGNAVTNFLGQITLFTAASNKVYEFLASDGPSIAAQRWAKLSSFLSGVLSVGIAAATAGLIAFGVATVKAAGEQRELTSALVMQGASLGLTSASAIDLAKTLDIVGVTTSDTIAVITEMAKVGNLGKDSIAMITEAAVNLNKWGGVAIADTVKTFASIGKDPVEATIKFAKETGLLTAEQIKLVDNLVKTEGKAAGVKEAMEIMGKAHNDAAQKMKDEAGLLVKVWVGFLDVLGKVKSAIMDVGRSGFTEGDIAKTQAMVNAASKEVETYARISGTESGGYKQALARYKDFSAELEKQTRLRDANSKATATQTEENAKDASELERNIKLGNELDDKLKSLTRTKVTQAEYVNEYIAKLREQGKVEGELYEKAKKVAELEWQKSQKSGGSKSENYYATLMREATNNTIAANTATQELTKSEQKLLEVKADPRFAKLTATQQADVIAKYDAAIAAERQTAMTEKLAEAEEHRLKLLGKSEGIGKQYYADMQKLEEFAKVAGWSREEIEELTRAVFRQTPAWKAYEKALEDVNTASRKFQEDSLASQASVLQENQSLNHRLSLLGKTAEEQKAITIEYQRANKIREVDIKLAKQLREIEEKIAEAKKKGLPESDYKSLIDAEIQARKDAAEQHKVINREVAVQYAEDMQREIDAIKSGISDSIVTALFEGGKAGSKKLRNLIVDQLKKPVTLVVQAAVNLLLGSLMGSVGLGGLASSALGSAGGSLLGSAAGSAAGGMFGNFLGGGSLTGMIGNITAGVTNGISTLFSQGIGSVFSQGTGLMAAGSAGGGLGTLLGGIGLPLLGIGALISGLSRKLKDVGIEGSFGGDTGFEGRKYKFYKGGFLRSDKTKYEDLAPEMQKDLGNAFLGMKKSVADMANTLGLGTEALEKFKTNIKVSFWNLKDDEIQAKLQEALATANNELAEQVIGTWETTTSTVSRQIQSTFMEIEAGAEAYRTVEETVTASTYVASEYAREGEKAIDTLTRLATNLSSVNTVFDALGLKLYDVGLAGANAASALVDVFGGLENFTNAFNSYYENFYSEEEKRANVIKQVTETLNKAGAGLSMEIVGSANKNQFRAFYEEVVRIQGVASPLAVALIKVSAAFASVNEDAEKLADTTNDLQNEESNLERVRQEQLRILGQQLALESKLYTLTGNESALKLVIAKQRQLEIEQLDSYSASLQSQIWLIEDANAALDKAKSAANSAYSELEKSVNNEKKVLQTKYESQKESLAANLKSQQEANRSQIEAAEKAADAIRKIANALANAVKQTQIESEKYTYQSLQKARALIAQAGETNNIHLPGLEDALDVASQDSKKFYSTFEEYAFAQGVTNGVISKLNSTAQTQLSEQERIIAILQANDAAAQQRYEEELRILDEQFRKEMNNLDATLETQKKLLDEAMGVNTNLLSVEAAIRNLGVAIQGLAAAQAAASSAASGGGGGGGAASGGSGAASGGGAVGGGGSSGGSSSGSAATTPAGLPLGTPWGVAQSPDALMGASKYTDADLRAMGFDPADMLAYAQLSQKSGAQGGLDRVVDNILRQGDEALWAAYGMQHLPTSRGPNGEVYTTLTDKYGKTYDNMKAWADSFTNAQRVAASEAWTNSAAGNGINPQELQTILQIGSTVDRQLYWAGGSLDMGGFTAQDGKHYSSASIVDAINTVLSQGASVHDVLNAGQVNFGLNEEDIRTAARNAGIPGFASGGSYQGGLAVVGEQGPEIINFNKPGMVYNNAQSRDLMGSNEIVQALSKLESRLEMIEAADRSTAISNSKIAKILERVTPDGDSFAVRDAV